jgi:hypothetical protein
MKNIKKAIKRIWKEVKRLADVYYYGSEITTFKISIPEVKIGKYDIFKVAEDAAEYLADVTDVLISEKTINGKIEILVKSGVYVSDRVKVEAAINEVMKTLNEEVYKDIDYVKAKVEEKRLYDVNFY